MISWTNIFESDFCAGAFRFQQRGRMCVTWAILCLLVCFVRKGLYVIHPPPYSSSSWMLDASARVKKLFLLLARREGRFLLLNSLSRCCHLIQKEILDTSRHNLESGISFIAASVFLLLPGRVRWLLWKSDARKAQNKKTPPSMCASAVYKRDSLFTVGAANSFYVSIAYVYLYDWARCCTCRWARNRQRLIPKANSSCHTTRIPFTREKNAFALYARVRERK